MKSLICGSLVRRNGTSMITVKREESGLSFFGVPPHGWTWDNFKKVTHIWERIASLGKSIARTDSFDSMKVLIDTDRFHTIEADVILSIKDSGYRLKIKEVGPSVQVI